MTEPSDPPAAGSGQSRWPTPGRRRSRGAGCLRLGLVPPVLLAVIVAYVGGTFVQVWQASGRDGARPAQAIVVMGAAQYDGRPSPVLKNRLDHALDLYDDGLAPLIVVTGGRQDGDRFTEATSGYNYLRTQGVPDQDIRKEVQGATTYESLSAVASFLAAEGIDDVIVVSGPAHAKRLAEVASAVGLDAAVSPSSGQPGVGTLARETLVVSFGRIVGYGRMDRLDR
jgi:uncharacterized SAM-binding protein YcdF (DUF218 family)